MKVCILLLLMVLLFSSVSAQKIEWEKELTGCDHLTMLNDAGGNVVIVGNYYHPLQFGGKTYSAAGNYGIFLFTISPEGSVLLSKPLDVSGQEEYFLMRLDSKNNIYLSYSKEDTVHLRKYNSTADLIWERTFICSENSFFRTEDLLVGSDENIYITGGFKGRIVQDNTELSTGADTDAFLAKLTKDGNLSWVRGFQSNWNASGGSLNLDRDNNIVVLGGYRGKLLLNGENFQSIGSYDVFIAKFDKNGKPMWAKSAGGNNKEVATKIVTDTKGNYYVTGTFWGDAIFGKTKLKSKGKTDIFLSKLDKNGNFEWTKGFGSKDKEAGTQLFISNEGLLHLFSGIQPGTDRGTDEHHVGYNGKNLLSIDAKGKLVESKDIKSAAYITIPNFTGNEIKNLYSLTIPAIKRNWKLIKYVNY